MPGQLIRPGANSAPRSVRPGPQALNFIAIETIVENYAPLSRLTVPKHIKIFPGIREIWLAHRVAGTFLIAMMNVPGFVTREVDNEFMTEYINHLNAKLSYSLDAVLWCPHDPKNENPIASVCNCRLPFGYGLPVAGHMMLESIMQLNFPPVFQTIVGGAEYKKLAEQGSYNYVSDEELQRDAIRMMISNPGTQVGRA